MRGDACDAPFANAPGRRFENRAHIIADERGVVTGEGGAIGDRVIDTQTI